MSKYERIFAFPADAVLVFAGLYGSIFSLISAFDLPADHRSVFLAALAAALLFTAVFSLKRLVWKLPFLLAAAGGVAWVVLRRTQELLQGVQELVFHIWTAYSASYGLRPPDMEPGAAPEGLTLLLALVAVVLGCYLAWGLVGLRTFWSGALVTALFLLPSLQITLLPHWAPLLALLVFYGAGLLTRIAGKGDRRGRTRLLYVALPLTLALLLAVRAAVPQENYRRSDWIEARRIQLTDWATALAEGGPFTLPWGTSFGRGSGTSSAVNLAAAGPLQYTGRTVLRVTGDYTGRLYLRGCSSGDYTGTGWVPIPDETYEELIPELAGQGGDWSTLLSYNPINYPALQADIWQYVYSSHQYPSMETAYIGTAVEIEYVGPTENFLYVPYHLLTTPANMTGAVFHRDEYLAQEPGYRSYVVYINPYVTPGDSRNDTQVNYSMRSYHDFAIHAYRTLPKGYNADAMTEDLLAWLGKESRLPLTTESEQFPVEWAQDVAEYLAQRCEYDPDTPYTPEGEDFVDYFLNESHRGYCMHFASAAAVLLRNMGIPTRYVSGYVVDLEAGKTAAVADYAAHAWVEVYCSGYGWQPVEVTPGFSGTLPWGQPEDPDQTTPTPTPSASAEPTSTPTPTPSAAATPTPTPAASPTPTPTPAQSGPEGPGTAAAGAFDLTRLRIPAAVLGAALLLAGAEVLRRRLVSRRRRRRLREADANQAVICGYGYLERVLRWSGAAIEEELLSLAEKARFSQHALTEEERARFLAGLSAAVRRTQSSLPAWKRFLFRAVYSPGRDWR